MGCLVSKELPSNAPAGRGPSALDVTDKECKMLIDEVSNIGQVDFTGFLTEMCRGSGPPEEVMLRRFNSVRNKLQYISADSSAGAG